MAQTERAAPQAVSISIFGSCIATTQNIYAFHSFPPNANAPSPRPPSRAMTSDHDQRVDATPRGQSQKQLSYSVAVVHRPGSPLKQEVVLSPDLPSSPRPHDDDDDDTPSHLRRSTRVYDQTQRWTVLTREAEADEVSLLSVTSEEKDYLNALVPDASPPLTRDGSPAGENARYSQVGSTLSGFEEGEFRGRDSSGRTTLGDEPRHQPEEKAFLDETIQFSEPAELPEFTPAEAPRYSPFEPSLHQSLTGL